MSTIRAIVIDPTLHELIPLAKSRYSAGRGNGRESTLRRAAGEARYTVDTPVPYRISDLIQSLDERMGRLENKRDLSPYRDMKTRLETISLDPRYAFMFGSLTVPRSWGASFTERWQTPVGDDGFLEAIVERWRNSSSAAADIAQGPEALPPTARSADVFAAAGEDRGVREREAVTASETLRRDMPSIRREAPAAPSQPGSAVRALRDRLPQR